MRDDYTASNVYISSQCNLYLNYLRMNFERLPTKETREVFAQIALIILSLVVISFTSINTLTTEYIKPCLEIIYKYPHPLYTLI